MNRRNNEQWRDFKKYCRMKRANKSNDELLRFLTDMIIKYDIHVDLDQLLAKKEAEPEANKKILLDYAR